MATFSVFEVWCFEWVRFLGGPFFLRSMVRVQVRFLDDALKNKDIKYNDPNQLINHECVEKDLLFKEDQKPK